MPTRNLRTGLLPLCLLACAGCSPATVVTRPEIVEVVRVEVVQIPAELTVACSPLYAQPQTNGDLLTLARLLLESLEGCDDRMAKIKSLH